MLADGSQYPDIDEDFNTSILNPEIEQDLDIEINDNEPAFLAGQTKVTLELSPVKIVKAPDGYVAMPRILLTSQITQPRRARGSIFGEGTERVETPGPD